jgi:hypothetical protein
LRSSWSLDPKKAASWQCGFVHHLVQHGIAARVAQELQRTRATVRRENRRRLTTTEKVAANFRVEPPDPKFEYFVDHAVIYGSMNLEFDPERPPSLLNSRPLAMLVQVVDESHVRVGFRARAADRWLFSKTLDTKAVFGKSISKIGYPCLASFQGAAGQKGWGVGNYPSYQQFLIDYVRFRAIGRPAR